MYKIYHIPTQRYLNTPEVVQYSSIKEPSINTGPTGRIWKTRGSVVTAFKTTVKSAKKCGLNPRDFRIDEVKTVVVHSILPHQI